MTVKLDRIRSQHQAPAKHPEKGEVLLSFKGTAGATVKRDGEDVDAASLPGVLIAEARAAGKTGLNQCATSEGLLEMLHADLFARLDAAASPLVAELLALDEAKKALGKYAEQQMKAKT